MNNDIIIEISKELGVSAKQVETTLKMLADGDTIPFIARYRKDATGNLDEEQIRKIGEVYDYQVNLQKRKEDVIRLIDEKGMLTDEIKNSILKCQKLVEIEDIYRPYKEKKKTKATEAINNGLEPLAKQIMAGKDNIKTIASKYINDKVPTIEEALTGAKYIISEYVSDNSYYRKWIRGYVYKNGVIESKIKKNANDENKTYEMYYSYQEPVKYVKSHRILAMNRGEKENVLSISIDVDKDKIIDFLNEKVIKHDNSECNEMIKDAIADSLIRLIYPSIEREIRAELKEKADEVAIANFSKNLESLLLQPPMKEKIVLAFDPGFVNGCKIAVVDKNGKYLDSTVIKPFLKNINDDLLKRYKMEIVALINKYHVDLIAIGNGTASRESEKFCSELIKEYNLNCKYVIVSEAGASIYSASKLAISEFPDLEVEKRSAVSIGRRLQDPLSELVKIPPEGIGVGLYQHDVSAKNLKESLDFVVSKTVNSVGVNINTASTSLLSYVAGITKKNIEKIINYREEHGRINSRDEIKKKKLLSDKVFEQAIGFLRITEGTNILDETGIHPESYEVTLNLLKELDLTLKDIGTDTLKKKLENIDINEYSKKLNTDIYTLEDIIKSLISPNRDPRDEMPQPLLKSDVLSIEDLKVGMKLQGTVRNVVDFGAFIDIGLHNDGLVHISKITDKYIKHPSDVLSVGDIVDCYVDEIHVDKQKVSLSLLKTS
ncbi:MAG: RNA-binding transcriptional accessory protein [Bacilli bacterium]|nr:RNA-binding transcriptional accessory protein [Bacilli bacterium]